MLKLIPAKKFVLLLILLTFYSSIPISAQAMNSVVSTESSALFPENKVIDVKITIKKSDYENIINNAEKEEFKIADVNYNGIIVKDIGIRAKGNSSLKMVAKSNSERFSYKLDFGKFTNNQTLCGITSISLNNNFSDPTYMREYLGYELFEGLDVPVPRHCYANLYINDKLIGLYLAVENITEEYIQRNFSTNDSTLYKPDGVGSDLAFHGSNIKNYPGLVDKSDNNTGNYNRVLTMIKELNYGNNYEKYINVEEVLRYLTVSTVISNFDSYQGVSQHNYYLYDKDAVFSIIPWDLNMSFGSFSMGTDYKKMTAVLIDEPTAGKLSDWPLIDKLLQVPSYKEKYHSYIRQLIEGPLSDEYFEASVTKIKNMITPHVKNQNVSFFTNEEFEKSFTEDLKTDVGVIQGFKTFTKSRVANIKSQLDGTKAAYESGNGLEAEMPPRGKGESHSQNASTPENSKRQPNSSDSRKTGLPKESQQATPGESRRPGLTKLVQNGTGVFILLSLCFYLDYRERMRF